MLKDKVITVHHTEHGFDFITLYFYTLQEANAFGQRLYNKFKATNHKYLDLQRSDFRHLPGDVEHFHTDGAIHEHWETAYKHIHVLYPHKPTEEDWEDLYSIANGGKIRFPRGLPTREVKR